MTEFKTIAESNNFIVLDKYTKIEQSSSGYQSESELENEFINDLISQGYEYLPDLNTPDKMLANVRLQLEALNQVRFLDDEWSRFILEFLDKPSDNIVDKNRYYSAP